jgi:hypothetical protein
MADPAVLLRALSEYQAGLVRATSRLRESFHEVATCWRMLADTFEGEAADQFRAGWERTAAGFALYSERSTAIAHLLEERLRHLQAVPPGQEERLP